MIKVKQSGLLLCVLMVIMLAFVSCATLNTGVNTEENAEVDTTVLNEEISSAVQEKSVFEDYLSSKVESVSESVSEVALNILKEAFEPIKESYKINGQLIDVVADKGKGTVYYPSVFSKEDVFDAFTAIGQKYMDYLSDVTFLVGNNKVDLTYPESWGEEEFAFAESILFEELPAYVDGLLKQNEVTQPVQVEKIAYEEPEVVESVVSEAPVTETKTEEAAVSVPVAETKAAEPAVSTPVVTEAVKEMPEAEIKKAKSNALLIFIVIFVVCVGIATAYYFLIYRNKKNPR